MGARDTEPHEMIQRKVKMALSRMVLKSINMDLKMTENGQRFNQM